MGILPNHSPLLTALDFGEVMVRRAGSEEYFAIGGGFVEIQPDHVTILADSAEQADEIDLERAERARREAEEVMREGVPEDPERYAQIRASSAAGPGSRQRRFAPPSDDGHRHPAPMSQAARRERQELS